VRNDSLYRIVPGQKPELARRTNNGNGTTFDLQGRVIQCEGLAKRLTRWNPIDGRVETLIDRFDGMRLNRPNDVICRSDGSILFTDPDKRVPVAERELDAAVYCVAPDGTASLAANCEYPNGLALSPDERTLYVANTRFLKYIHEIELDAAGKVVRRRVFADMSWDQTQGSPDGIKVDVLGRVYCTGPGGIWVFTPDGKHVGTIRFPQPAVNFAFGDADLRTLFCCAQDSVYTLRVKVPGQPHPWYRLRTPSKH
jgi:gluconolactonase